MVWWGQRSRCFVGLERGRVDPYLATPAARILASKVFPSLELESCGVVIQQLKFPFPKAPAKTQIVFLHVCLIPSVISSAHFILKECIIVLQSGMSRNGCNQISVL